MASLGDAYIDVHANTDAVEPEIRGGVRRAAEEVEGGDDFDGIVRAADRAGSRAGDGFGNSFIRDASGRLRDSRGRFVTEGERVGREAGEKMSKALGDSVEKNTRGRINRLGQLLAPAWIKTVGVWIAAAAPSIIQLAGTLAPVVGILGALVPAAIGAAASLVVMKLAFGGLSAIVKEASTNVAQFNKDLAKLSPSTQEFVKTLVALKPVLADFKKNIQENFFQGLDETFNSGRLTKSLSGLTEAFGGLAYVLGSSFSQALGTLTTGSNLKKLNDIISGFAGTMFSLGPILSNIVNILLTLGTSAGPLLDTLFTGLDRSLDKFTTFLSKAAADGSLQKFFDDAIIAGQQLLKLTGSLLSIIGSLLEAGKKAGGGDVLIDFFAELADIFKQLNASGALTAFFKVFNQFFGSISTIIKPLLPLISKLISLFGGELTKVLVLLTPPLTVITKAIADALIPVLPSLEKALDSLLPSLALMAGVLADVFKEITPDIADVLVTFFATLAQTLIDLAPTIKDLLPTLGQLTILLVHFFSAQTIGFLQAFTVILPLLAKAIEVYAVPQLKTLYAILKVLNVVFSEFVIPFLSGFATLASKEMDKLGEVAGKIGDFFSGLGSDIADFFTKTLPKWFGKIGDFFEGLPELLKKYLKKAIKQAFDTVLVAVGVGIGVVIFTFTKLPGKIISAIGDLGGKLFDFLTDEFDKAVDSVFGFLTKVDTFVRSLPGRIADGLSSLGSTLKHVFKKAFDTAIDTVTGTFDKIVGFVKDLPHRIEAFTSKLVTSGIKLVTGFLSGLSHPGKIVNSISDTVFGFLKDKINFVITKLNEGIDKVGEFVPGGIPHIPKLARGAFLKHPTLALLAEAGPEVVLPTNDAARARELLNESGLANSLDFHSSTPNVNVRVYIGQRELTDIVDTRVSVANENTARQLAFGARTA